MKHPDSQKPPPETQHLPTILSPYSQLQSTRGSIGGRESFGGLQSTRGSLEGRANDQSNRGSFGGRESFGGLQSTCGSLGGRANDHEFSPHPSDTALLPNAVFNPSQQTNNPLHTALTRDPIFDPPRLPINLGLASHQSSQRGHQYSTPAPRQQDRPHTRYVTTILMYVAAKHT